MATPMNRDYEFFVTTDEPHQPAGMERGMIRRLVMRNYFETKMAGPQLNVVEHSSANTVMAKKQLKNRFRLSEPGNEKRKNLGKEKKDTCEQTNGRGRRPQVLRTRSGPTPSSSATGDGSNRGSRSNKMRTNGRERNTSEPTMEMPALEADPSSHRMDPFDALPIPGTPQLDALFRLHKSTPKDNHVAIDAKHTWRSFILNDAGLLHATLASWALYGVLANGFHRLRVCKLKHKTEAIKIVNRKLAMCEGNVTDEVVGTVLTLANLDNLMGAYDAAQLHITALKCMVDARGGLFAFGHNDGLLRGIIWIDFHTAAAFRTPPSFPHISLDPDTPPFPDELMDEAAYTSPTSLLQLSCAAIDCFNIFYRLHQLAFATSSHWTGRVARLPLSNFLYETQFIILSVPDRSQDFLDFDHSIQVEQSDDYGHQKYRAGAASVVEALLAAALIFVYAVLRALPLNTKIFTILLSRLRTAIDRPNISLIETWKREKNLNMLLWVLVVACSVAAGAERIWWITQLSELCGEMYIGSRRHLEHELQHVVWTDSFFDNMMDGIWAEVMRLRGPALWRASRATTLATAIDPAMLATWT